jgi:hypothetical protein
VGKWIGGGNTFALQVWQGPDDDRPNLYAGGFFATLPDGSEVNRIARWNGQTWRDVGGGVTGFGQGTQVDTLAVFDEDGEGPNPGGLYAGGLFYQAGGIQAFHIARWGCPLPVRCDADLDGDSALTLFDFLAFVNLFNARDARADWTGDNAFDVFDFLGFFNDFNLGC